ncbi:hypothetical protein [Clostridium culturomicium]|uniref:hypothetical protein n=1 Tax=Clostridium culturomicium TaxID=1499683 RepID=UPI0038576855
MDFEKFCEKFSCSECPLKFSDNVEMCICIFEEAMNNGGKFTIDITDEVEEC